MIDLTPVAQSALAAVRRAGSAGLALGDEIPTGLAVSLELHGLVVISRTAPQVVKITAKGASFLNRGAFA